VWSVKFISQRLFNQLPGANVSLDLTVFGFALAASVLTGLIFGTVPAWLSSRVDVNQSLRENSRGSTSGRSHNRLRHLLIVGEVAFALVLLAGAGLFLRGLQRFGNLDPGWRVDGLVTAQVRPQGTNDTTDDQRRAFLRQLEERVAATPSVQRVALSKSPVVWGFYSSGPFIVEGQPEPDPSQLPEVFMEMVSTDYFETLGIRLLEGRTFSTADAPDHPDVVIINEAMAKRFWPNERPLGKRIKQPGPDNKWQEVVGVVNDVGFPGTLGEPYTRLQTFRPLIQSPWGGGWVISVRSATTPEAFANELRAVVSGLDHDMPVYDIRTARSMVEEGLGSISLLGTLLGAFALLGLTLAAIGIYGVTSYSVVQRTGELGIRMALGAQRKDVLWLVLGKGLSLMSLGTAVGLGGAYAVARLLIWSIPTLPTSDPMTIAVTTLALAAVALLACYIPAHRATKVDPMVALRSE
jgi:predicted permease